MNNNAAAGGIAPFFCMFVGCGVGIGLYIAFLATLQRALASVREQNRDLSPGMVWLSLVPVLNWFWNLVLVIKIGSSLKKEFEHRDWNTEGESFGRPVGLVWTVGNLVSCPFGFAMGFFQNEAANKDLEPIFGLINCGFSIMLIVCMIIYSGKINGYARLLNERRVEFDVPFNDEGGSHRGRRIFRHGPPLCRACRRRMDEEFRRKHGFKRRRGNPDEGKSDPN